MCLALALHIPIPPDLFLCQFISPWGHPKPFTDYFLSRYIAVLWTRIETNADPDPASYLKQGIQIRIRIQGAKPMQIRILDRLKVTKIWYLDKNPVKEGQDPLGNGGGSACGHFCYIIGPVQSKIP
jgi:hypothetical protein